MPLPLKDRKISAIEYVIKRIKGSDSYDRMKDHNEYGSSEKLMMREQPEADHKPGMKMAINDMMSAMKMDDHSAFEKGLRQFIEMMLDERKDDEELMSKNN